MNNDQITTFLEQRVDRSGTPDDGLEITTVYGLYVSWCLSAGLSPLAVGDLSTALRHHGLAHDDGRGRIRVYPGTRVADPALYVDRDKSPAAP